MFQGAFSTLVYEAIGDDDATSFFRVESRGGEVTINRDLKETDAEVFRVSPIKLSHDLTVQFNIILNDKTNVPFQQKKLDLIDNLGVALWPGAIHV